MHPRQVYTPTGIGLLHFIKEYEAHIRTHIKKVRGIDIYFKIKNVRHSLLNDIIDKIKSIIFRDEIINVLIISFIGLSICPALDPIFLDSSSILILYIPYLII